MSEDVRVVEGHEREERRGRSQSGGGEEGPGRFRDVVRETRRTRGGHSRGTTRVLRGRLCDVTKSELVNFK